MKQLSIIAFITLSLCLQIEAQLKIADDNNVGIGVTEPESKLAIGANGNTNSTFYVENNTTQGNQRAAQFYKSASGTGSGEYSYAVIGSIAHQGGYKLVGAQFCAHNSSLSNNRTFGVRGFAGRGASGFNYSIFGYLFDGSQGAAIFGAADGNTECQISGEWAGYFRGNVKIEYY
mgnify:CR=1 FL=1